jgi:hypothetical protein
MHYADDEDGMPKLQKGTPMYYQYTLVESEWKLIELIINVLEVQ